MQYAFQKQAVIRLISFYLILLKWLFHVQYFIVFSITVWVTVTNFTSYLSVSQCVYVRVWESVCVFVLLFQLTSWLLCVLFLWNLVELLEVKSNWFYYDFIYIRLVMTSLWHQLFFSHIFLLTFCAWLS